MTGALRFAVKVAGAVAVWVWVSEKFDALAESQERLAQSIEDAKPVDPFERMFWGAP